MNLMKVENGKIILTYRKTNAKVLSFWVEEKRQKKVLVVEFCCSIYPTWISYADLEFGIKFYESLKRTTKLCKDADGIYRDVDGEIYDIDLEELYDEGFITNQDVLVYLQSHIKYDDLIMLSEHEFSKLEDGAKLAYAQLCTFANRKAPEFFKRAELLAMNPKAKKISSYQSANNFFLTYFKKFKNEAI